MANNRIESVLKKAAVRTAAGLRPGDSGGSPRVQIQRQRGILPQSSHRRYHCLVDFDDGAPPVSLFAKKAPPVEYENLLWLQDLNDPRIEAVAPRPFDYLPEIQYLLMEFVDGVPLMNRLAADCLGVSRWNGGSAGEVLRRSAAGLAQLHNAFGSDGEPFYDDRRLEKLATQLEQTGYFTSSDLARVDRNLLRTREALLQVPAVSSHGEFGPRNIILRDDQGISFIDWPHLMQHNLFYDVSLFLHSLLGLSRVFPWSKRRLKGLTNEFRTAYLVESELATDPELFEASRLVNMIEILLRSHHRLRSARNRRVRMRATSYIRHQQRNVLAFLVKSDPGV